MQTFQNKLLALAGVAILALIGSLMNSRQTTAQAAGSAPVTIVGPLPLPVTGSTTVSGTVAATQSGLWNVGITGTPSVQDLLAPGSAPLTQETYFNPSNGNAPQISPVVPSQKRFIVLYLAATALSNNSAFNIDSADCLIRGPVDFRMIRALRLSSFFGGVFASGSEQMFLVLNAGDQITMSCDATGGTQAANVVNATLTGYFVPAS